MNNSPEFIEHLFAMGSQSATAWLNENRDAVGKRSTVNLKRLLPADFSLSRLMTGETKRRAAS